MRKTLGLLLLLVVALGIVPMLASADCTPETPIAQACESGGVVLIDGADTNPDPLDGSLVIDTNAGTVCADSSDPDDEGYDPACFPE